MPVPEIRGWLPELLDHLDEEVFVHTIDGVPLYANSAFLRRLGSSLEEFAGLGPYGWVPEESRAELPQRIEELAMHGHSHFESSYTSPRGARATYEVRMKVLSFGGEPVVLAVGRDVSGRRHMMEDLNLRAALLDLVDDGIIVHEADGTILYANNAAATMHGYRRHRMLQLDIDTLALDPTATTPPLSLEADAAFTAEDLTATGTVLRLHVVARMVEHRGSNVVVRVMRPVVPGTPA